MRVVVRAATVVGYCASGSGGAAWVKTGSGGIWTQQGAKLVGTVPTGVGYQCFSVSSGADRNTAMVGGYFDYSGARAAWVYIRSGGIWTQQGAKVLKRVATGTGVELGCRPIIDDTNTAIVGGSADNSGMRAAWVYIRSGGIWTSPGAKDRSTRTAGLTVDTEWRTLTDHRQ